MPTGKHASASDLPVPALAPQLSDAQALNRRGIAWLTAGDCAAALADFQQSGRLQPDYPEAWNNSGLVRQLLGQLGAAVADFDQALALRPAFPEALTNRGRVRQVLGDFPGARADFDRALRCAAGAIAASVLHNRGKLRQEQGDLVAALADFDRALEIDPKHIAAYVSRGLARKDAGNLDGARADFDRALAQNPAHGLALIYHGRGGVRVLQHDFAGAVADYDQALRLEPENFCFYISRGNAHYHRRDPCGVLDFLRAYRLNPEGTAREVLGNHIKDVQSTPAEVLDNCTRHLRLNDRDGIAYGRRGYTLLLLGRDAEAASDLAQFRQLVPELHALIEHLIELAQAMVQARCKITSGC